MKAHTDVYVLRIVRCEDLARGMLIYGEEPGRVALSSGPLCL